MLQLHKIRGFLQSKIDKVSGLLPGKEIKLYELTLVLRPASESGNMGLSTLYGTGKFRLQYERLASADIDPTILSKLATGKLELEIKSDEPTKPPTEKDSGGDGLSRSDKLDALLNKRLVALRAVADQLNKQHQQGLAPPGEVLRARQQVFKAELELAKTDKDRTAILEKRLEVAKDLEVLALKAHKQGTSTHLSVLDAEINRLEAEIALERAKAKLSEKDGGKAKPKASADGITRDGPIVV
jgi:uncharacterized protein YhaN